MCYLEIFSSRIYSFFLFKFVKVRKFIESNWSKGCELNFTNKNVLLSVVFIIKGRWSDLWFFIYVFIKPLWNRHPSFKGILHPKMLLTLKLLQNCMSFFLLLNTKEDILKNDWNFGTIDFHSRKKILWKSMVPKFQSFFNFWVEYPFKGTFHFKIHFWCVLSYLKGIQDVGVFVSGVVSILIFLGQTVLVC